MGRVSPHLMYITSEPYLASSHNHNNQRAGPRKSGAPERDAEGAVRDPPLKRQCGAQSQDRRNSSSRSEAGPASPLPEGSSCISEARASRSRSPTQHRALTPPPVHF